MTDVLPRRVHIGYALGSLATGTFGTVPGLLLLPYLTDTMGVAAGVAGLLVLVPKAWDVLVNPVAGRISDRWGGRRPYLLGGGFALAVLFTAIFAAPAGTGAGGAAYVAVAFLATATAFAFFQVPYVAMPAEITDGYAERTRLMTWRVAFLALAILVSGAVAPLVVSAGGDGIPGHRWMGLFCGALIVAGAVGVYVGTRSVPTGTVRESEPSLRAQLGVRHIGDSGYLELASRTLAAVRELAAAVSAVDGLRLVAPPESTVVCFTAERFDVFVLADELAMRGWHTQPQFAYGEVPASIHLSVTASVAPRVGEFGPDLAAAADAARAAGPVTLPDVSLDRPLPELLAALGFGEGVPERMAPVNALLNAAPPHVREALLVDFLGHLQRPATVSARKWAW